MPQWGTHKDSITCKQMNSQHTGWQTIWSQRMCYCVTSALALSKSAFRSCHHIHAWTHLPHPPLHPLQQAHFTGSRIPPWCNLWVAQSIWEIETCCIFAIYCVTCCTICVWWCMIVANLPLVRQTTPLYSLLINLMLPRQFRKTYNIKVTVLKAGLHSVRLI